MFLLAAIALVVLSLATWIACDWSLLVKDTPGARARWALVLAGEGAEADRTQAGLGLVKAGRTDSLLVSGTPVVADIHTSTILLSGLAQETEVRRRVLEARHASRSTVEEAQAIIPLLQSLGADTVLLVTSNYHTRRAADIFNCMAPTGMRFVPVATPCRSFAAGWENREGAKLWLLEWSKTFWWNLVDRWSSLSLQPGNARSLRYPDAGQVGAPCPVCPAPVACPPAPACPQVTARPEPKPEVRNVAKPKEKPKATKSEKKKDKAQTRR